MDTRQKILLTINMDLKCIFINKEKLVKADNASSNCVCWIIQSRKNQDRGRLAWWKRLCHTSFFLNIYYVLMFHNIDRKKLLIIIIIITMIDTKFTCISLYSVLLLFWKLEFNLNLFNLKLHMLLVNDAKEGIITILVIILHVVLFTVKYLCILFTYIF